MQEKVYRRQADSLRRRHRGGREPRRRFRYEGLPTAFSASRRTFFIMEAVTQYLTQQGMERVFGFLARASAGSRLVFAYVRKDFLDGKVFYGWESGYKRFVKGGIWFSAFEPDELPGFPMKYGWKVIEDRGYDELAGKYLEPLGRRINSTPVERMVFAEKS